MQKLQAMTSQAEQAVWQAHTGLAIERGRLDSAWTPWWYPARRRSWIGGHRQRSGHRGRRGASSGGTFLYQAGVVPENAFAGAAYMLALAVNGDMADGKSQVAGSTNYQAKRRWRKRSLPRRQPWFDPGSELFDLLGGEFIAFSSFPSFDMTGFGPMPWPRWRRVIRTR